VIESEEKERDRIAAELHDGVCQDLTVAKLTIELADGMINEEDSKLKEMVSRSRDIILHSLNMTRRVSHQLMPKELFDRHFCDIVTEMIDQLNLVDNIRYELNIHGNRTEMNPFVTINLYRIIQEFIRNSQKHSTTEKLSIDINFSKEKLSIKCKDYGQGFDLKKKSSKGIGLLNIGKRIDGIGGSFRLMSKVGEGVELSICYPV
jgi:signal transduction histidine kinase